MSHESHTPISDLMKYGMLVENGFPTMNKLLYPPTPVFAKAGAAPGTTGGVEPALSRPWPSHCPRLPPSPVAVSFCCSSVATCRLVHIASVVRAFKPAVCQPSNP